MIINIFCLKVDVSGFFKKKGINNMSTDPTGLGSFDDDNLPNNLGPDDFKPKYNEIKDKVYINKTFTEDDWCTYSGECKRDNLLYNQRNICLICEWRRPLDIPKLIDTMIKERKTEICQE